HRVACELEQEISQRADCDLMRDRSFFFLRDLGMPRGDFRESIGFEPVDKIVSLYSNAFASTHLDKGPAPVFVRKLEAKLPGGGRRERDHLVREVNACLLASIG